MYRHHPTYRLDERSGAELAETGNQSPCHLFGHDTARNTYRTRKLHLRQLQVPLYLSGTAGYGNIPYQTPFNEGLHDYGTSKVVGRDQEHIKLELVDNKSNNVMNGIAFGQSSHVRYIKTKRSFDICYTIEENTHKRGEVQLQIEDIKPIE